MDENKDEEDFQEETIKEFLKPRICLERLRKDYFRLLERLEEGSVTEFEVHFDFEP